MAKEVTFGKLCSKSKIYHQGKKMGELSLKISGYHNILNALGAIAVGVELGIEF